MSWETQIWHSYVCQKSCLWIFEQGFNFLYECNVYMTQKLKFFSIWVKTTCETWCITLIGLNKKYVIIWIKISESKLIHIRLQFMFLYESKFQNQNWFIYVFNLCSYMNQNWFIYIFNLCSYMNQNWFIYCTSSF